MNGPQNISRLFITKTGLLVLALFFCVGCKQNESRKAETPKKLNVLFLFTDDQRAGTINALGNNEIRTPHIDKLVAEGFTFTNATIMGAMNGAVCAPSRSMLMTGRPLFKVDPTGSTISANHIMLPEQLRKYGYHTFHTGKWHNGIESFVRSFDDGQNIFFGGMSDHYKVPLHNFEKNGEYKKENTIFKDRHSSELYADAAIDFINYYKGEEPFFAFVSFQAPHDPRQTPPEYLDSYLLQDISTPPNFLPRHPFDNGELEIRDEWLARMPRTKVGIQKHLKSYYSMITHMDVEIGRILEALENNGKAENTLIVFASDNGLAVGQHGLMGKQNLYEHSIKVPLIFSGPQLKQGVNDSPVYLNDIYPTLCDLLNIEIPDTALAKSLVPILKNESHSVRTTTVHAYKNFQRAIRLDSMKLIAYNVKGEMATQLFNLDNDPYETNDLADEPEYESIANYLIGQMQKFLEEMGDEVRFDEPGWNVPVIKSWEDKMKEENPETLERLKKMAKEEQKSYSP